MYVYALAPHTGPSKTLGIFCHKSLEFQVSSIGAVQEDGVCWQTTHQESQLHSANGNCMHDLCAVYSVLKYVRQCSVIAGDSSIVRL